jgi:hypothetical protein
MLTGFRIRFYRSIFPLAGLIGCLASIPAAAQYVAWPAFGPERGLLQLDGLTDVLPDFVGPVEGSAELTIFTEGNHYPVLLPLVLERFPAWCRSTGSCRADAGKILVVTLPQAMIVDMLVKGGIRLGNAVIPVGRDQHVFPDFVMAGSEPLRQLAGAGMLERQAAVFARHRGLGLLLKRDLADVSDIASFRTGVARVVLVEASSSVISLRFTRSATPTGCVTLRSRPPSRSVRRSRWREPSASADRLRRRSSNSSWRPLEPPILQAALRPSRIFATVRR